MEYFDVIASSPMFASLDEKELRSLLKCLGGSVKTYKKRETILSEGTWVRHIGIIVEGSVDTIQEDFWGDQVLLGRFYPPQSFADAFVLADLEPLMFYAVAAEESKVFLFDYERTTSVCKRSCAFHRQMLSNLLTMATRDNLRLLRKINHLTKPTTREKLLAMLSSFAQEYGSNRFTLPYTRQELANYLAINRSAMTSELTKLQREGLVTVEKNTFELHHG